MFWTNWNEQSPSIMRATLAGANVLVIIGSDIRTPNGLAIDHRAEKLYFSDATLDKIERCEYDGTQRHVSELQFEVRFFFWLVGFSAVHVCKYSSKIIIISLQEIKFSIFLPNLNSCFLLTIYYHFFNTYLVVQIIYIFFHFITKFFAFPH